MRPSSISTHADPPVCPGEISLTSHIKTRHAAQPSQSSPAEPLLLEKFEMSDTEFLWGRWLELVLWLLLTEILFIGTPTVMVEMVTLRVEISVLRLVTSRLTLMVFYGVSFYVFSQADQIELTWICS